MAGSTDVPDDGTPSADSTDPWTSWKSLPLPRKLVGGATGGAAASLCLWLLNGDGWSVGRFVFNAVWWALMLPVLLWLGARRRDS